MCARGHLQYLRHETGRTFPTSGRNPYWTRSMPLRVVVGTRAHGRVFRDETSQICRIRHPPHQRSRLPSLVPFSMQLLCLPFHSIANTIVLSSNGMLQFMTSFFLQNDVIISLPS